MSQLKDALVSTITEGLDSLPVEIIIVIISCFPIVELRGALPIAMERLDMGFWEAYTYSVIGNMLPVLPLLMLFQPLSKVLMRFRWYESFYKWLYVRTMKKSEKVEKYGAVALILFTAVPFPTTGAWTACAAASFLNIRIKYAFVAIGIGVLIAGLIIGMTTVFITSH